MDIVQRYSLETMNLAEPASAEHLHALENLAAASASAGDTAAALDYLREFTAMAHEARLAGSIYRSINLSAFLAVHVGDIERAEAEALAALDYGNAHGLAEQAIAGYGGVIYNVRRAQGRATELIPLLEGLVESQARLPVWRVALAGACYFARRFDVVHEQVSWLAADGCARVPLDLEYPVTLCGLGRLAPYADLDEPTCEFLYGALTPFAGMMNYTGTSISDANDVALASIADRLGWFEKSDHHYRDAVVLADRAGAVPYGAHYRYEWARALIDRGEQERARPLLREVVSLAEGRDMHGPDGYVVWSRDLLAGLS
jgi:tetratricopeptide (TPR) repeat protein